MKRTFQVVGRLSLIGRVLPISALARATAVQRIAGIQLPVAVGSVRLGNERPMRLTISDGRTVGSTP